MLGMDCRIWIYATRTHTREQSCQILPANLFLWPTEPLTEASGAKVGKNYFFVLNSVIFHLSWLLFPHCSLFTNLTLSLTRTSQAVTVPKSLEIHLLGNPIALTADLLDRKLMYLTLPEEVQDREGNTSWPAFYFWSEFYITQYQQVLRIS